MSESSENLKELLRSAQQILIFTGAGVSTGSGIPDFRGPKGVWKTRQPVMYQDFMSSEDARVEYWDQKLEAYPAFAAAQPNELHKCLASLEQANKLRMLVTQNIDGLHSRAGVTSERLVELHGTNTRVQCQTCAEFVDPDAAYKDFERTRKAPQCDCGGWLKPATISFGQSLKTEDLRTAFNAAAEADLVVALGSSLSVYPAAEVPIRVARRGIPYIIVNRGVTEHDGLDEVTLRIDGDVVEVFPPAVYSVLEEGA